MSIGKFYGLVDPKVRCMMIIYGLLDPELRQGAPRGHII
jgi:hypothetical protein